MTKLGTLALTTVKVPGDEPMHTGAAQIALHNPRLSHFSIAYIPGNKPMQRGLLPPQPTEMGKFTVVRDRHNIPVNLLVQDTYYRFAGIGKRVTKRSLYELRPAGHPDAEPKGWVDVLFDRSPAGEEARLLLFSAALFVLAMYGIVVALRNNMETATGELSSVPAQGRDHVLFEL